MAFLALEVQWEMGLLFWVSMLLCWDSSCAAGCGSKFIARLTESPSAVSNESATVFSFQPEVNGIVRACSDWDFSCKLDGGARSDCRSCSISYGRLSDGNHSFAVCRENCGCTSNSYYWTIDTIPPTATITTSASLTSAPNVSVTILFSEPCTGGGGFRCSSVDDCNLLISGAGQVIPSSLHILQPNLEYTLSVSLNFTAKQEQVILTMDENFCTDNAGNRFTRTSSSNISIQLAAGVPISSPGPAATDTTNESSDLETSIPEETIQVNNEDRTVQVTSNPDNLRFYLNFSRPVMNSSTEILKSLNTSQGTLLPIDGETLGNQKFGFMVANISSFAIITISLKSESIITEQGNVVSPLAPITFVYDSQRPTTNVSTTSTSRTRESEIPISIKFAEPMFGFNSSNIVISGGRLLSFLEMSKSRYFIVIKADDGIVSVSIPENATGDIAGNKNLASNVLQVRHYSKPIESSVASVISNAALFTASLATGLLSVSTASLQASGAIAMTSATPICYPSTYLFRMAGHVQVFALSRWLAVELPVEYYELARDLQWSIPYFSLPWEVRHVQPPASSTSHFSDVVDLEIVGTPKGEKLQGAAKGPKPLSAWDIMSFLEMVNSTSEAAEPQHNNGWTYFGRNMFWLVIIDGSLIFLHALLLLILTCKKKTKKQGGYMALIRPRLEMLLSIHALPSVSQASSALIRGGTRSGMAVGILLLVLVAFELLSLFLFLSVGITFGKLLQYDKGQGTWKKISKSVWTTICEPLYEDLSGPPENKLSQICGANPREDDRGTASDCGTKFGKVLHVPFGIVKIYYPLLECIRRVILAIFVGYNRTGRYSRTPTIALLCFTSYQLLLLVLKKLFQNKRVQLVEIISVSAELGIFASIAVVSSKKLSEKKESGVGIFMVALFLIQLAAQMVNMWDALYKQVKRLDPDSNSFRRGLKMALLGLLMLFTPEKTMESNSPEARPIGGETADLSPTK